MVRKLPPRWMRVLTAVNGAQDVDGGGHPPGVIAPPVDVVARAATRPLGERIAHPQPGYLVEEGGQCHAPH